VAGLLARRALAQAEDVGDDAGPFLGEGLGGQADGTQEIRLLRELRPQAGVLLVERVMAGDQGQHATRLEGVERFGEEEVMQGQAHAVVVQSEIGKRHIADDRIDGALGQAGVAEVFDTEIVAGVQHARHPSGEAVELQPMKRIPSGARAMKLPMPQPGSSTAASAGTPRCRSAACIAWTTTGEV
jgi:hypothetical protein